MSSSKTSDFSGRSSSAPTAKPHHRLTLDDLRDPARFKTLHGIPLIDAHEDKIKGDIDEDKLHLISKNSNDRGAAGNMAAVTLGHTQRKQTIVIIRPDNSRVILPGVDETNQPPVVGFASNFHVAPINGKPFMHGDLHIYHEHVQKLREYPFRSIERLTPPEDSEDDGEDNSFHYTDRISLLKTPPERDGGIIAYERMPRLGDDCDCSDPANALNPRCLLRVAYDRDLPAIAYEADDSDDPAAPGPDCPCHDSKPKTIQYEASMPGEKPPAPAAAPAPEMAPPAPAPDAAPPAGAGTIGDMTMEAFMAQLGPALQPMVHDAVMNSFMTLMPPEGEGGEGDMEGEGGQEGGEGMEPGAPEPEAETMPAKQYEDDEGIPPAVQTMAADAAPTEMADAADQDTGERTKYQFSEPGSMNVSPPGTAGAGSACATGNGMPKKKLKEHPMEKTVYEREVNDLRTALAAEKTARVKYESDLAETQEVMLILMKDREDAQLYHKRTAAKDEFQNLIHEGWKVDIDKEVARITLDTPDEYLPERVNEIRTMHARSVANVRHTIPIGGVTPTTGKPAGISTAEQAYEAANFAVSNGCTIPEAKASLATADRLIDHQR